MRFLVPILAAALLIGCGVAPQQAAPREEIEAACYAQGHEPGTEGWRVCMEADGVTIATGPGSPYAYRDKLED